MVAYASCYRRYLWSRNPFTSCTHLDANFRCVCACSSIFWLKRSLVFLVDDAGTTEWRLAATMLMDCGERSTTPTSAQAGRLRSSRDVRCSDGLPDRRASESGRFRQPRPGGPTATY